MRSISFYVIQQSETKLIYVLKSSMYNFNDIDLLKKNYFK